MAEEEICSSRVDDGQGIFFSEMVAGRFAGRKDLLIQSDQGTLGPGQWDYLYGSNR